MSYTTHFHEKVYGEKEVYFDVPENARPGRYTQVVKFEEDVHIDITVDTKPFDRSVEGCATSVNLLTGSVVAAGAAEATSKLTSADKVGRTVVSGFFGLVEQNFRVQAMEEQAMLTAVSGELVEQAKELSRKKEVMSGDYSRIKGRYMDLFTDLDKELHTRVFNLLKPCFKFTENAAEEQNRNVRTSLLATSMVAHKENLGLQARLSSARMKQRAMSLIQNAKKFLQGQKWLGRQIEEMLVDQPTQGSLLVPVIVIQKREEDNSAVLDLVMSKEVRSFGDVESCLRQSLQHSTSVRQMNEQHRSRITEDFNRRVSHAYGSSEHERRVAVLMQSLYERAEF